MTRPVPALVLLAAVLAAASCGYNLGPPRSAELRSIAVPIFRNDTREREIEYPLTLSVVTELKARGWNVTSSAGADVVLEGRITGVSQDVTAEDPSDLAEAGTVKMSVEVVLRTRSGREISRTKFSETGEFAAARGQSRDTAGLAALRELASAVARSLETLRF